MILRLSGNVNEIVLSCTNTARDISYFAFQIFNYECIFAIIFRYPLHHDYLIVSN